MGYFLRELEAPATSTVPIIEWEEPDCLLCGGRQRLPLVEAPDDVPGGSGLWFAVVQCQECGLCFTSPRPSPTTTRQFYPASRKRRAESRERSTSGLLALRAPLSSWLSALRSPLSTAPVLTKWHGQGRLLDIGCGRGSFLLRMHREGWQVTGIDPSAAAVQRIHSECKLRALAGTLPHPELQPASFDMITMRQALEHVHDPLELLRHARRLLVRGGKLVVSVPNIDSLPFRWFGTAWCGLDLPRHLTHFTPCTLQMLLQQAGFRAGPVRMVTRAAWLQRSARRAYVRKGQSIWNRWLTFRPMSRLTAWYAGLTRQSDCMLAIAER